jgi:hypothetical protein
MTSTVLNSSVKIAREFRCHLDLELLTAVEVNLRKSVYTLHSHLWRYWRSNEGLYKASTGTSNCCKTMRHLWRLGYNLSKQNAKIYLCMCFCEKVMETAWPATIFGWLIAINRSYNYVLAIQEDTKRRLKFLFHKNQKFSVLQKFVA